MVLWKSLCLYATAACALNCGNKCTFDFQWGDVFKNIILLFFRSLSISFIFSIFFFLSISFSFLQSGDLLFSVFQERYELCSHFTAQRTSRMAFWAFRIDQMFVQSFIVEFIVGIRKKPRLKKDNVENVKQFRC